MTTATSINSAKWMTAHHRRTIETGVVDVWRVDLDADHGDALGMSLSADEKRRADRFRHDHDRRRFIAARSGLRKILAGYLDDSPASIEFHYTPTGKPFLAAPDPRLHFNLSHAGRLAVYVIGKTTVGIDLERIRPFERLGDVAFRAFAPSERHRLAACGDSHKLETFYRLWTRREALIKGLGSGLPDALDRHETAGDVPELDDYVAALSSNTWTVCEFVPDPGYIGAIAVGQANCALGFFEYPSQYAPGGSPRQPEGHVTRFDEQPRS